MAMMNKEKCCENCDKCSCSQNGYSWTLECCEEHKMSKEHLEHKKEMLEKKLRWVEEQLGKK